MEKTLRDEFISIIEYNVCGMSKNEAKEWIKRAVLPDTKVLELHNISKKHKLFKEHFVEILEAIANAGVNDIYKTAESMVGYCWNSMVVGNVYIIDDIIDDE